MKGVGLQLHPVPVKLVAVKPAGKTSVTLTALIVAMLPTLPTVSV